MYVNMIASVCGKLLNKEHSYDYRLDVVDKRFLDSHCDDDEFCANMNDAEFLLEAVSPLTGQRSFRNTRIDLDLIKIDELVSDMAYSRELGGMMIHTTGSLILAPVVLLVVFGTGNYEIASGLFDEALRHPHLFISFFFELQFSGFPDNPNLTRPVTKEQFLTGVPKFESGVPKFELVRRVG